MCGGSGSQREGKKWRTDCLDVGDSGRHSAVTKELLQAHCPVHGSAREPAHDQALDRTKERLTQDEVERIVM
jgi:hypothetical protein